MKKIFSTIILSFICISSFSQIFEWKRMSGTITDTSYHSSASTTNILKSGSNYCFAYQVGPYHIDNYPNPGVWLPGSLNPVILSNNNQLIFADTIINDSISITSEYYTTFIQNDTFRILVNYAYLDSAVFAIHSMYRKGLPVPKCKGFLLINYSLTGGFLGYDSLALPTAIEHLANVSGTAANRALYVKDLFVNSQQEVFMHLGYWLRGGSFGPTYPLDTTGFIIKYNSDLTVSNKIIPVMLKNRNYDFPTSLKLFNDKLYLLGSISDSVIVDNMLFTSDTTTGYKTFAVEFDRNLYSLISKKLPGSFNSFTVDQNSNIYISAEYNFPLNIDGRLITPTMYADPDTFYTTDAFIMKLQSDWTIENYLNILDGCQPPVIMSNDERIFFMNLGNCGNIILQNGDTIDNPVNYQTGCDNLILINNSSLIPSWTYNFPLDNNVHNIYFNSDKMLMSFDGSYIYLSGFGDTDTVKVYNYYPVALSQINITGLGFEEISGSEAAPLVAYPNPASDQLFLKLPENNDFVVSVFDLNGKRQLEHFLFNGENTLNVSVLNTGLYIIRAQNEEHILTGKFLKE